MGRDGLRHQYPNSQGDGNSRSSTKEHLGKDCFRCFLNDCSFSDKITPQSYDTLPEEMSCVLYDLDEQYIDQDLWG